MSLRFVIACLAAAAVSAQSKEDPGCESQTGVAKSCKTDDDCCDALVCKDNWLKRGTCEEDCQDWRKWCSVDSDCCGDLICVGVCDDPYLVSRSEDPEPVASEIVEEVAELEIAGENNVQENCVAEKGVSRSCLKNDDCCDDLVCKGNFVIGHSCEDNCAAFREYCVYDEDCCGDEY